jgi:hypothetical protein
MIFRTCDMLRARAEVVKTSGGARTSRCSGPYRERSIYIKPLVEPLGIGKIEYSRIIPMTGSTDELNTCEKHCWNMPSRFFSPWSERTAGLRERRGVQLVDEHHASVDDGNAFQKFVHRRHVTERMSGDLRFDRRAHACPRWHGRSHDTSFCIQRCRILCRRGFRGSLSVELSASSVRSGGDP